MNILSKDSSDTIFPSTAIYGFRRVEANPDCACHWATAWNSRADCPQVVGFESLTDAHNVFKDCNMDERVWNIAAFLDGEYKEVNAGLARNAFLDRILERQPAEVTIAPSPTDDPSWSYVGWVFLTAVFLMAGLYSFFYLGHDSGYISAIFCAIAVVLCGRRAVMALPR